MSCNRGGKPGEEDVMSGLMICGHSSGGRGRSREFEIYGSVPVLSVEVKAAAVHAVGQVEITQVYRNNGKFSIETVFFFPIDSCAPVAVTHFKAEFDDGSVVKGIVKTKEEANVDYKKAVTKQMTAFLGEQVKRNVFNIKVGRVNPGVQVKVIIGYVTEFQNDPETSSMRFVLPTSVVPQFTRPGVMRVASRAKNRSQHSVDFQAPLSINLDVSINQKIESISSPTHSIVTKICSPPSDGNWSKWSVTLKSVVTEMETDFVVLVTPKDISQPRLYKSVDEDGSLALMAHLVPKFKPTDQNQMSEFVIVIDRSRSMRGRSIEMAKKTLTLFLHSLPEDCYFNIVTFGSSYECLYTNGSQKYDEISLKDAMDYAKNDLRADLGGTDLKHPLLYVLSRPAVKYCVRQVFVITDGKVSETDDVIGIVKRHAHRSRVFSLGIGSSASTELIRAIAAAGRGTCAFVGRDNNIVTQTLSQLKNATKPALFDVAVLWTDGNEDDEEDELVEPRQKKPKSNTNTWFGCEKSMPIGKPKPMPKYVQAPVKIPPIFDGSQLVVAGIFSKEGIPTGVEIFADTPGEWLELKLQLSDPNCSEINPPWTLHKLAAAKIIQELEAEEAYATTFFSARKLHGEYSMKKEICEVALKYGLASKYTSFVAVREDGTAGGGQILIPPMLPSGDSSVAPTFQFRSGKRRIKPRKNTPLSKRTSVWSPCGGAPIRNYNKKCAGCEALATVSSGSEDEDEDEDQDEESSHDEMEIEDSEESFDSDEMCALVNLQSCKGSFQLTEKLCELLGLTSKRISYKTEEKKWKVEAFATCLAIAYLKNKLASLKDEWELVGKKSERWLSKKFADHLKSMTAVAEKWIAQR